MARWTITISKQGLQPQTVKALARKIEANLGKGTTMVEEVKAPSSRADRLAAACEQISEARSEIEELRDELQGWYDNLPENLQNGMKADELQSAIDGLEEILDEVEEPDAGAIEFPGTY